jgi:hypothetical protein
MPSFLWLRWGLANFLPRLASNTVLPISTSQVASVTDVSHHAQLFICFQLFVCQTCHCHCLLIFYFLKIHFLIIKNTFLIYFLNSATCLLGEARFLMSHSTNSHSLLKAQFSKNLAEFLGFSPHVSPIREKCHSQSSALRPYSPLPFMSRGQDWVMYQRPSSKRG